MLCANAQYTQCFAACGLLDVEGGPEQDEKTATVAPGFGARVQPAAAFSQPHREEAVRWAGPPLPPAGWLPGPRKGSPLVQGSLYYLS